MGYEKNISFFLALIVVGCSTNSKVISEIDNGSSENIKYRVFEEMIYDDYNLPLFKTEVIDKSKINKKQYIVVFYEKGRFVESRLVGIVPGSDEVSFTKPFKVIYKWTGRGFKAGWELLDDFRSDARSGNPISLVSKEIATIITGVVGGIGGFIAGVGAGTQTTYEELSKFFSNKEIFLNRILYKYDSSDKLEIMQIFDSSKDNVLLAKTKYYYKKIKLLIKGRTFILRALSRQAAFGFWIRS